MEPFELLKFRTMSVDTDDAPHREYIRSIMDTSERTSGEQPVQAQRATTR